MFRPQRTPVPMRENLINLPLNQIVYRMYKDQKTKTQAEIVHGYTQFLHERSRSKAERMKKSAEDELIFANAWARFTEKIKNPRDVMSRAKTQHGYTHINSALLEEQITRSCMTEADRRKNDGSLMLSFDEKQLGLSSGGITKRNQKSVRRTSMAATQ